MCDISEIRPCLGLVDSGFEMLPQKDETSLVIDQIIWVDAVLDSLWR